MPYCEDCAKYWTPSAMNELYLREGRAPEAGRADEVLVHEAFAQAWGLRSGASITAVLNGRRQSLRVTGVALSPEFVYVMQPGALVESVYAGDEGTRERILSGNARRVFALR